MVPERAGWGGGARELADRCFAAAGPSRVRSANVGRRWDARLALPKLWMNYAILVSMTRITRSTARKRATPSRKTSARTGYWIFQEAKARLSEVVRRARSEGPQHVTVHGRDGVVVIAEEEFRRLKGDVTGAALVAAMQASPFRETEIEPKPVRMPFRDVGLP
jgi:prevent-host-death family protein